MNEDVRSALFWLIAIIGVASVEATAAVPLATLESTIPHIELTQSAEAIGGATIEDAVVALRQMTSFPICIEILEYDRQKDGLTLGRALEQLHALKGRGEISPPDQIRLERYEALATSESPSTLIGYIKRTFSLVEKNVTVRALLDRLTELDSSYAWKNYGSEQEPIVVIQPRTKSGLDWSIPSICSSSGILTKNLFGPGGKLTLIFQAHDISLVETKSGIRMQDVRLDLCKDHLVALDVLNLAIKAVGNNASWALSGIKGLRWLTFQ
ncbi:MAG TPA: hypothetical protein VNW97_23255 [Candidatus Saccharimonadales bacterium]|jgi:hypothetical protein|nr:hypothetical protein [Candidatus Saccharimonadales bacterium]